PRTRPSARTSPAGSSCCGPRRRRCRTRRRRRPSCRPRGPARPAGRGARPWRGRGPRPRSPGTACAWSVSGRLPALEHAGPPVLADGPRALDPGAELGLRELGVGLLELDAVGVAGLQVRDEDLARELVLAACGDREVDLQEGVRVAIED